MKKTKLRSRYVLLISAVRKRARSGRSLIFGRQVLLTIDLIHNPTIVEEIGQLMSARELRVWHDQIQYKPPQVGGVNRWHQDSPLWGILTPKTSQVSAWVALDDANDSNGCMRMVRGSYHWGSQMPFFTRYPGHSYNASSF